MKEKYIRASFTKYIIEIAKATSLKYYSRKNKADKEISLDITENESICLPIGINTNALFAIDENINYTNMENIFEDVNVSKSVKKLTDVQKQVIYLTIVEEYSIDEVANIVGTSIDNIYQIKSRAIKKILKNLKGE